MITFMHDLPPENRHVIAPLFAGFPIMPTVVNAVINEGMGRALVDDVRAPNVAFVKLDFTILAGDPAHPTARTLVDVLDSEIVPLDERWQQLVRDVYGAALRLHRRVAFRSAHFDRGELLRLTERLPAGFEMCRVDRSNVEDFATLGPALVGNFNSVDRYLERGLGFGIQHDGRFVSAVSSFCVAGDDLEIEIQTRPEFRRRGFATIAAARMILHCLDHGITPHWDAHNEPSAQLARKLGFCDELAYETYSRATD